MLTTLPNRVSALLADPFQAAMRELNDDFRWIRHENDEMLRKVAPLSIWEDDNAFYIDADVPGIALEDLDVALEKGKLTIRGERKPTTQMSESKYDERFYGQFQRTVAINEWVDPNRIEANLADGVLHLKLSKKPESQRQKVRITHGGATIDNVKRIEKDVGE